MKLTQKTIFQCFEKPRSQSPIVNSSSDIPQCDQKIEASSEQKECYTQQPDFVLPVHIRQYTTPLNNDIIPSLNERKINDDPCTYSKQEFYRICPTTIDNTNNLPQIECTKILSIERQMELFDQYIQDDQSIIDWKSIFDNLQDYRKKAIEQNQYEHLLWTDLYRPKSSKTYLGNHTKQIKRLNEWFTYWTKKLHSEEPKKTVRRKRKRASDDDNEISDEDFSDNSNTFNDPSYHSKPEHPKLIFIHGSGTTSLVHALAEEHNFKITEINGSQSRARAPLLKQLEQVTNHHQLSLKRCPSDTIMSQEVKSKSNNDASSLLPVKKKVKHDRGSITSFFNQMKTCSNDGDEQKENKSHNELKQRNSNKNKTKKLTEQNESLLNITDNNLMSSVQVEKTSLILFDEIETLTADDNFWSCLKKLLETAKKPIILTSNSRTNPEDAIMNLSKIGYYELIHLEQNESNIVCCYLRLILLIEMFEISSFDDLLNVYQYCSYDLRQTLITIEFLVQSSNRKNICKSSSILSKAKWQSSLTFDAMHYSYLKEQLNDESILKIYFDNLTKKYSSEYEQSHSLLLNQYKNNSQRIELFDTFKLFMQEQTIDKITDHRSFYLDYRPFIRQICQSEQIRANQISSNRRLRHSLSFRGCSLQWSDFEILSTGID